MRPLVLITTDRRVLGPAPAAGPRQRPARPELFLKEALVDAVRAGGGLPLLLPPGALADDELGALLDRVQAVVVSGGAFDIDPRHYGQAVVSRLDRTDADRTDLELSLCRACLARDLPLLGLCGGMQAMAVAAGGSLVQDLGSDWPGALEHEQPEDPARPWHPVELAPGILAGLLGPRLEVNSTHHQAVRDPGPYFVSGRSPDGAAEAMELPGHRFAVGVQWHPELLGDDRLFRAMVGAAR